MYKTAESVSPKHPDKLCDQISDAILDACLTQDPFSRVAIEVLGGHGLITISGEITSRAIINPEIIVEKIVGKGNQINTRIVHQSAEIAQGVDHGGAGDQGIMVGYATNETENLIPLEVNLSRELCKKIYVEFPFDGKTQVTVNDNKEICAVVSSFQNAPANKLKEIIDQWLIGKNYNKDIKIFANPAGDWQMGGFEADTGLTGRKLIVDNYGPRIPIGGGAYSGKDATKVDRSGAYMARRIAVDYLRKYSAGEVFCYLAYCIGVAEPMMAQVMIDGRAEAVIGYDLRPESIIERLNLRKPQLEQTARWGHYGENFIWDI